MNSLAATAIPAPISWQLGEHVAIVGDTGTGKTYLTAKLVEARRYVVMLALKDDPVLKMFHGFTKAQRADKMEDVKLERILLKPRYERQAFEAADALERVWRHGNWTVVIDELWYAERLGLSPWIERLLTQGRSKNISVIAGMQRPAFVSRFAISQCTHLFSFRLDRRDAKTIRDATTEQLLPAVDSLQGKDFAYYHRARRLVTTGNANTLDELIRIPPSDD
jgi:hypothetical protein